MTVIACSMQYAMTVIVIVLGWVGICRYVYIHPFASELEAILDVYNYKHINHTLFMISIKKMFLLGTLALALVPSLALAQQATTTAQARLIADVNITSNNLKVEGGAITGSFTAMSSFGNQDAVSYGLVFRSVKTGALVDASPALGTMALVAGVAQTKTVTYEIPQYMSADVAAYLNLSNASGLVLANVKVGDIKGTLLDAVCNPTDTGVTCTTRTDSVLSFSVYEGGAQGKVVSTASVDLPAKKEVKVAYLDLMKDLDGGRYLVVGAVSGAGKTYQQFAKEYFKAGTRARIASVSMPAVAGQSGAFKAVIYTNIFGYASTSNFTLSMNAGSCGASAAVPVSKDNVTELAMNTSCTSGTATITLYENGTQKDTYVTSFTAPQAAEVPAPKSMSTTTYALIGIGALLLALIVLVMKRRGGMPAAPSAGGAASTPKVSVAAAIVLLALFATFAPNQASAATYSLSDDMEICFDDGNGSGATCMTYPVSGSITAPSSVVAYAAYQITVSHNPNNNVGGSGGYGVYCYDNADHSDGGQCDTGDLQTTMYGGASGTAPVHAPSTTFNLTAPSSGTVSLGFNLDIAALSYAGCSPAYPTKCSGGNASNPTSVSIPVTPKDCEVWETEKTYDGSPYLQNHYDLSVGQSYTKPARGDVWINSCAVVTTNAKSCPITNNGSTATCSAAAAPTVNVQFSLLQKMFSVFALSN